MKTKRNKKITIIMLIAVVVVMYGFIPRPEDTSAFGSISNASDLISESDIGASGVTHTITFETGTTTEQFGFWRIEFPWQATNVGGGTETCGYGDLVADVDGPNRIVDCREQGAGGQAATSTQFVITDLGNATTSGEYSITITHYDSSTTSLERVTIFYAILDNVVVSAQILSTLEFDVVGTSTGAVNGISCGSGATASTLPFGTLTVGATTTLCQFLTVKTNADDGYTVTVEQDNELESGSGANINSFDNATDGTGSSTNVHVWRDPLNTLDVTRTYGHFGLTSNDSDLVGAGLEDFYNSGGTAQYAGLNSTDPLAIMEHGGPTDISVQDVGKASIAYSVQVMSLQEAGDYESTLTYICTPTY